MCVDIFREGWRDDSRVKGSYGSSEDQSPREQFRTTYESSSRGFSLLISAGTALMRTHPHTEVPRGEGQTVAMLFAPPSDSVTSVRDECTGVSSPLWDRVINPSHRRRGAYRAGGITRGNKAEEIVYEFRNRRQTERQLSTCRSFCPPDPPGNHARGRTARLCLGVTLSSLTMTVKAWEEDMSRTVCGSY